MATRQSLFTRVVRATLTKSLARVALVVVVALGLGLGAAACSDDTTQDAVVDTTAAEVTTTVAAAFPVTVGDLTVDVEPQRVVSMSATATEMLFAIGAGDKVVAVDNFSNFPAEVESLPKVDAYQPSVEAISELEPDLVIISYDPGNLVEQLNALSIPVFAAYAVTNLDGVYLQMEQLGALTGRSEAAAEAVATMRGEVKTIIDGVVTQDPPLTYYYELDPTLYSVTSNTFIGGVMSQLGLVSIADGVEEGNDYPQLSAEVIVEKDPDIVFLADVKCCAQSAATVAARDAWGALRAVSNGNVVELDDDIASRWGPRLVDLLAQVAAAVAKVTAGS